MRDPRGGLTRPEALAQQGRGGQANPEPGCFVQRIRSQYTVPGRHRVSLLKRLLGQSEPPKPRVRVCVECGMPVAEHKDWCAIRRGQMDMQRRAEDPPRAS